MNRLTIRTRITIGTLLLAAIFFAGAAFGIDRAVAAILETSTAKVLASDAAPYEAAIEEALDEPLDSPAEGQLVAVVDPAGTTRVSNLSDSLTSALPISRRETTTRSIETPEAIYLVRAEKIGTTAGTWIVYTARNDAASDLVRNSLRTGLIVGLGLLTLLFGAASWLLTGAALRPVGRLRRDAEVLASSDSRGILPVGDARDEVHDLAVTLNSLIEGLHTAAERERQMVSDASHELRTPLAILQAQLELLRTGDKSTLDDDLGAAQRAVARLSRLSSTLLELSRIEATAHSGRSTFAEVGRELVDAVDRARFAARASSVTIYYSIDAAAHLGLAAVSPHDFGRIVDNLVENAVRAALVSSKDRDASVDIRLSSGHAGTVLVVTDTGPGMPDDFVPRAFDRFTRASEAREADGGSGLGLSIVYALVQRAGGTITLENMEHSGLVAKVILPTAQGSLPAQPIE